ncbi:hypothetical protein [Paraeggerthella sp. Marseille-Q4926]|uniref:hypothetical protein n=1 Tax=unclassified Paraeggerthella TaxID=2641972 RepID=UPI0015F11DE1|nr:hypothetical protein [Paraeggerthella sp. Marseille-Q4926]
MSRLLRWADGVRDAVRRRPGLLVAAAGAAVVALVVLLAWFIVFSGFSQPVQFVYDSF